MFQELPRIVVGLVDVVQTWFRKGTLKVQLWGLIIVVEPFFVYAPPDKAWLVVINLGQNVLRSSELLSQFFPHFGFQRLFCSVF